MFISPICFPGDLDLDEIKLTKILITVTYLVLYIKIKGSVQPFLVLGTRGLRRIYGVQALKEIKILKENKYIHIKKTQQHQIRSIFLHDLGLEVIKLFSCSTQLTKKFPLLINIKMHNSWHFYIYQQKKKSCPAMFSRKEFAMERNLRFISRTNFVLS